MFVLVCDYANVGRGLVAPGDSVHLAARHGVSEPTTASRDPMTDSFQSSAEQADDYLDPQFHDVDPATIALNDNAELDSYEDDSALADLEALDGDGDGDGDEDEVDQVDEVDEVDADQLDSEAEFAASLDDPSAPATAQGSLFAASTGDPRVDGAVSRLGDLATSDITEHPAVLEDVHRRLHDALADLDR